MVINSYHFFLNNEGTDVGIIYLYTEIGGDFIESIKLQITG